MFKSGDKVRVRKDLNTEDKYYTEDKCFVDMATKEMLQYRGKEVTIAQESEYIPKAYLIYEDKKVWLWVYDMFEVE